MSLVAAVHRRFGETTRRRALANIVSQLLPESARVLDLGCGDGTLAKLVVSARPDIQVVGVDSLARGCQIPFARFDGKRLPFASGVFDAVIVIDVLHHASLPRELLIKAGRVSRSKVILKDHLADRICARLLLRIMDWAGNARFGVSLPYTYWSRHEWDSTLRGLGWTVIEWRERLGLYRAALEPVFGWGLHFVAVLRPPCSATR